MTEGADGASRRARSVLELALLMGAVPPLLVFQEHYALRRVALFAGCLYVMLRLRGHLSWAFLFGRPPAGWWRGPCARGALVLVLALAYVVWQEPQNLFSLPRRHTGLWLLILALYPLLSVLPQELIFRVWLFEAHRSLWVSPRLPVLVGALFFGWAHIIYAGWFAVLITIPGGLVLAWNYSRSRTQPGAVWPLCLEHSLYGLALFTVGLGRHFFLAR